MATPRRESRPWRATYRLQLTPDFGFDAAAQVVPYLARLGISHVYLSPVFQAGPGSTHGYDVMDHSRVSDALGGPEAHARLMRALEQHGLGQLLDIVPNHMSIAGRGNAWWWDVLENGQSSRFAGYFDIDWEPPEQRLRDVIVLPVLGDHYGRVLEAGGITLHRDGAEFTIRVGEQVLPVDPRSLSGLIAAAAHADDQPRLAFLAGALESLPRATATDAASVARRHRDRQVALDLLADLLATDRAAAAAVDAAVADTNRVPDRLDALLDLQSYRLVWWPSAERDLDYRRFFDVNHLVGLNMDDERVFRDVHRLAIGWVKAGVVDGLRVDHPDGLKDPAGYAERLREAAPGARLLVEKILAPGEQLPPEWPVDGTTGYEFLNAMNALFVDPAAEAALSEFSTEFTGQSTDWGAVAHERKLQVLRDVLGSDVSRLAEALLRICEQHRRYRDYSRHQVTDALREVVASFGVYRTYVRPATPQVSDTDRRRIDEAIDAAKAARPDLDALLFDFIRGLLLLEIRGRREADFVQRLQQLCAPATAKGVEDTAFYVFNRFVALNEVGGDPGRVGLAPEEFHRAMAQRLERTPYGLNTTETHDTKRSLDVRARLSVLSQVPDEWAGAVRRWSARNERHRTGELPDRNAEYLLYQTLAGAWPIDAARAWAFMEKAAREAKTHTSWSSPHEAYETALRRFVEGVLGEEDFRAELEAFVAPLLNAGRIVSLAQVLLSMTAPGTPDIYQGAELWSHALVDPDNRRQVDYALRADALAAVTRATAEEVWPGTADDGGLAKLWLVRRALQLRARRPTAFARGRYEALPAEGREAGRLVAFTRCGEIVAVVPRLMHGRSWLGTTVELPRGNWVSVLTDERWAGQVAAEKLLARFPVALLEHAQE